MRTRRQRENEAWHCRTTRIAREAWLEDIAAGHPVPADAIADLTAAGRITVRVINRAPNGRLLDRAEWQTIVEVIP